LEAVRAAGALNQYPHRLLTSGYGSGIVGPGRRAVKAKR
jgi:hypothetical protein